MIECQQATTLAEVRRDHLLRYEFAANYIKQNNLNHQVLDLGCGTGYGSHILSLIADNVTCVDKNPENYQIYQNHFARDNINYLYTDVFAADLNLKADCVTCFEFVEHTERADELIAIAANASDTLIISSPNELVRPHKMPPVNPYHVRHYTPDELAELIGRYGFKVQSWFHQISGAAPDIVPGTNGKFMIAIATK